MGAEHAAPAVRHGQAPVIGAAWVAGQRGHGRAGRLFPDLPPCRPERELLLAVSETMRADDGPVAYRGWTADRGDGLPDPADNPDIPAGYTFFGQFLDHDLTYDGGLRRAHDAAAAASGSLECRAPRLDLDTVYGAGPSAHPFLYLPDGLRFRLGSGDDGGPDLLRLEEDDDGAAVAVVPDPRNDENAVVAQVHLAVAQRHNRAVLESGDVDVARDEVRTSYHRAVVEDFLPRICGESVVGEALRDGPSLLTPSCAHLLPVEFSGAAFRFGHSQIRPRYQINEGTGRSFPVFARLGEAEDLRGGRRLGADHRIEDLKFWFSTDSPQRSRRIDRRLTSALFVLYGHGHRATLPSPSADIATNLAARDLERSVALGLPSGESVADELAARGLIPAVPGDQQEAIRKDFWSGISGEGTQSTPLWGWVLSEASVLHRGRRLGPVGATIVAHTVLGLLYADPRSRIRSARWEPGGGWTVLDFLTRP